MHALHSYYGARTGAATRESTSASAYLVRSTCYRRVTDEAGFRIEFLDLTSNPASTDPAVTHGLLNSQDYPFIKQEVSIKQEDVDHTWADEVTTEPNTPTEADSTCDRPEDHIFTTREVVEVPRHIHADLFEKDTHARVKQCTAEPDIPSHSQRSEDSVFNSDHSHDMAVDVEEPERAGSDVVLEEAVQRIEDIMNEDRLHTDGSVVDISSDYEVDMIVDHAVDGEETGYRVRWRGCTSADDEWLTEGDLSNCQELLADYKRSLHDGHTTHPTTMAENQEYEVASICDDMVRDGETMYRVNWKGFGKHEDEWKYERQLHSCRKLLDEYKKRTQRGIRGRKRRPFTAAEKEYAIKLALYCGPTQISRCFFARWSKARTPAAIRAMLVREESQC